MITIAVLFADVMLSETAASTAVSSTGQNEASLKPSLKTLKQLVTALKRRGKKVRLRGKVEQPFFGVQGQIITVENQDVQVFEYRTVSAAERDAGKLNSKGSSVGTSIPMWVAPPHFFTSGRLIVLYVGDNAHVVEALTDVLGPQLAGK
jgi:hypothetical protein